jgi:thiamine kinase-like enzyme
MSDVKSEESHLQQQERKIPMAGIENIEALTADLFSGILRDNWSKQDTVGSNAHDKDDGGPKIDSFSVTKVDKGVLSNVYRVHLDYSISDQDNKNKDDGQQQQQQQERTESTTSVSLPPSDWLVKFCRPELGLSWMFRNEKIFYSRLAPTLMANAAAASNSEGGSSSSRCLPFTIPKFLSGSDQHIILQEVINIETYPLSGGCPPGKIDFLLKSLAAWHAASWESELLQFHSSLDKNGHSATEAAIEEERLVVTTGMGQRLPPLQKEGLFITSWKDTISNMRLWDEQQSDRKLDAEFLDFITNLCQRLVTLKLRDIHEKVHRHRVTCVHGDFHIANWLFPKATASTSGEEERKPVLVDFATTGYGNPLIDLVFFIVVSTNDDVVSDSRLFLEQYYRHLIECDPTLSSKITLSTLHEWFPWALLCQFMILVAYDGVCRDIAAAESDEQKRNQTLEHFCNVNRRMVLAIRSIDNWDAIISKLEPTTPAEQHEAREFCQNTPLVI